MVWLAPTVRAVARSQSTPTPNTQDPLRVVTSDAEGAPDAALAALDAPTGVAASTPVNVITVMEAATPWDRFARTVAFASALVAKARQISAVPSCALARRTSCQVSPLVAMLVTVT